MGGNSFSLLLDVDVLAPHMVYNDTVVEEISLLLGDGKSPDSPVQCSIHCTVAVCVGGNGDESPGSLLGRLRHYLGRGVGVPHYKKLRLLTQPLLVGCSQSLFL